MDFAKTRRCPTRLRAWSETFSTDCPSPWASKPTICSTYPRWGELLIIIKKETIVYVKWTIFYNQHISFHRNHWKTHSLSLPNRENIREGKQWVLFLWPGAGRGCIQTWALSSSQRRALITPLLAACGKGTNGRLWPNSLFRPYQHSSFSLSVLKEKRRKRKGKEKKKGKRFVQYTHPSEKFSSLMRAGNIWWKAFGCKICDQL